jgi:hypothetical protein
MKRFLVIIGCCLALADVATAAEQEASPPAVMNFVTRRGDKLFDGEQEFRFISFNIPNLMVIEDAYDFTKPNPWRWPDEFEIEDALESVRQMGGRVARTYVLSVYREGSDMGDYVHVRKPGEFNEEGFRALDKVVEIARRKGIRVIIPFVDQAKWWGGIGEYAAFRGREPKDFWTDRQITADFKATIAHLINRKNIYTGVAYRDEPAIFGWETGNEIDPPPEWTREIAAFIKQLDPNHLVIDGKSLKGVPLASLDDPNVDVITTHHYPWGEDHDFTRAIRAAHGLTKGKKAYFVGEFGFVELPHIAAAIKTVVDDGISGALLWSLRMHRREGGFYWHMEVGTGRNIYKAFHWPGFASGDRYDERAVLQLMHKQAYAIQGIALPRLEPPASPTLLPIERANAISWQGSAGASSYSIWRTGDPNGPWQEIAPSISDAETQYQPLFNDHSAIPGEKYWYRVVAKNSAGQSAPSNVVGPVIPDCRTLVDECRDLSLTNSTVGNLMLATENARTVQEDCHRIALDRDAAIVYRTNGPIANWRIFLFARDQNTRLDFSLSRDGKTFETVECRQQAFPSTQTVYGYLVPILLTGTNTMKDATHLKIARSKDAINSQTQPDSDKSTTTESPVQIARVEIDFDSLAARDRAAKKTPAVLGAPVNPAVFVWGDQNLDRVLASIDAAAEQGNRRLNVVVTILTDLTQDLRVKTFGQIRGEPPQYQSYNDRMRVELEAALRKVFARMNAHSMDIYVLPHIDAGGDVRTWRNWVDFDPLTPYGGQSYNSLMLDTIADALEDVAGQDTRIELALSGEMGTSLFKYPASYREIIKRLRQRSKLKQLKIGISLNHGGIAGHGNPTGADDIRLSAPQRDEVQALIHDCDFVGMSFYRPVSPKPTTEDFVSGIEHFMGEFHELGLSVPTTKTMHFSEVGIGGGRLVKGAASVQKAVDAPWEGTADPQRNPWRSTEMVTLRRHYHHALLDFLRRQPAQWRVSAAFFWSMGSWDPQGFQHKDFADREIMAEIERHNRALAEVD